MNVCLPRASVLHSEFKMEESASSSSGTNLSLLGNSICH